MLYLFQNLFYMKKITFAPLFLIVMATFSSFTKPAEPTRAVTVQKVVVGVETFYITCSLSWGAWDFFIDVERQGPDAGVGSVEFDVDIMYNGNPATVQTHHISMSNGQLTAHEYRQSNTAIGTDVYPAGDAYNIVY